MKRITSRLAAVIFGAVTAACTVQATVASAITDAHPVCGNTQEMCEYARTIAQDVYFWSVHTYPENTYWNETLTSSPVFGPGYSTTTISGNTQGAQLSDAVAWARNLAISHFGSENLVFTEQPASAYTEYSQMKAGDQIVLTRNGQTHALYVTGAQLDRIYCSELVNHRVKWGVEFRLTNDGKLKRVSNGQKYTVNYFVRPVKEGDANGDSIVDVTDVDWILAHAGSYNFPDADYNTQMAAADLDGNWSLSWADAMCVYMNCEDGRMRGNYSYYVNS